MCNQKRMEKMFALMKYNNFLGDSENQKYHSPRISTEQSSNRGELCMCIQCFGFETDLETRLQASGMKTFFCLFKVMKIWKKERRKLKHLQSQSFVHKLMIQYAKNMIKVLHQIIQSAKIVRFFKKRLRNIKIINIRLPVQKRKKQ